MKDPYEVRTITEGELAKALNKTTYFGEWKTNTPDAVVRDWFNITIETTCDDNGNEQLYITNTGLAFKSTTIGMEGISASNVVGSYIASNVKWTFLEIGFINAFTRIIIDVSMSKGGTPGERYQKMNSAIRHSIVINSPTMLRNILETQWDVVTLLYFVELNKHVTNPEDLDLDFYRKGFAIEPEMNDYIIDSDYFNLLKKAQKDNSTEITAILIRWKKDYDAKKEAEGNKDGEIGL